jgi:cysteine desulfurase / selenocysteine lyase
MNFDVADFRKKFPILDTKVSWHDLIYFDSAASSLKPKVIADTLAYYYLYETANIHRGAHYLSRQGTEKYEQVREKVRHFVNATTKNEIVFTRGTTEAINLIASSYGGQFLKEGDEILLSPFEHHSNLIPWRLLSEKIGCKISLIPFDENGQVTAEQLDAIFTPKVKLVSVMIYSNVTGVRLDVEAVIAKAKSSGAVTVLDAAQAMLHESIDVQKLDCDFLTFSSHKMLGPYGAGVLFGKYNMLEKMPPYQGGGSMVSLVTDEEIVYQDPPFKFEAGTPSIADVLGLGAAIDFINHYSIENWVAHGKTLMELLEREMKTFERVKIFGPLSIEGKYRKADILSFSYEGAHSSDVSELLDQMGIAVRAGHHCAQPLMKLLRVSGTVRVSLAPYNTMEEIEKFLTALRKLGSLL